MRPSTDHRKHNGWLLLAILMIAVQPIIAQEMPPREISPPEAKSQVMYTLLVLLGFVLFTIWLIRIVRNYKISELIAQQPIVITSLFEYNQILKAIRTHTQVPGLSKEHQELVNTVSMGMGKGVIYPVAEPELPETVVAVYPVDRPGLTEPKTRPNKVTGGLIAKQRAKNTINNQ